MGLCHVISVRQHYKESIDTNRHLISKVQSLLPCIKTDAKSITLRQCGKSSVEMAGHKINTTNKQTNKQYHYSILPYFCTVRPSGHVTYSDQSLTS